MSLSAGSVSLGVHGDASGFGSQLTSDIMGMGSLFSGLGKHMGSLIVAGLGAIGVAASIGAVFKAGLDEYKTADSLNAQFAAGIKSTGNAANLSVQGMNDLAESIIHYSGQTDESIGKTEQLLQTFTNIRNVGPDKIFDQATIAAADMAAKMGGDASSEAIKLGRALQDPTKGITALTRVGVVFTQAQKDQVAALMKSGDIIGAQKIILGELTTEFGGAAKAAGQTLPGQIQIATRAFDEMSMAVVGGVIPLVLPAIQWITQAMKDAGPGMAEFSANVGQKIADAIRISKPFMSDLGKFISDTLVPDLKSIATWITDTGVPAVQSFVKWVKDNQTALEVLGTVIMGALMPVFATMAVAWVTAQLKAVTSAAVQFAAHYTVVAGWLMSAGAAATSAAETVAIWLMLAGDAVVNAAKVAAAWVASSAGSVAKWVVAAAGMVAEWLAAAGKAALHALAVAASWVGSVLGVVAAWAATALGVAGVWLAMAGKAALHALAVAASWVGSVLGVAAAWVATNLVVVGGWIATAAVAMASGIKMAAAWVIGLGPIAWVIAGIGLLVAAFVWAYATQQWFRDGVDWMWKGIQLSFANAWNGVIAPVLRFLVDGFVGVMNTFGDMLIALGHVPGFSWATDAGTKIKGAADNVAGLSKQIKDIPVGEIMLNVTTNYSAVTAQILGAARGSLKLAIMPAAEGVTVLPTPGGTLLRVGEAGRAESVVDTGKMNALLDRALGSGTNGNASAGNPTYNIYETVSAQATAMQVIRIQNQMAAV